MQTKAEDFRERAIVLRRLSGGVDSQSVQQDLLRLADEYDQLATKHERGELIPQPAK